MVCCSMVEEDCSEVSRSSQLQASCIFDATSQLTKVCFRIWDFKYLFLLYFQCDESIVKATHVASNSCYLCQRINFTTERE